MDSLGRSVVENVALGSLASGAMKSIVLAFLALMYMLYVRYATPLRKIPGPFLASITKLWVVQQTRGLNRHLVDIDLRKKYGTMVRVAPNEVMISNLDAIKTIYGIVYLIFLLKRSPLATLPYPRLKLAME